MIEEILGRAAQRYGATRAQLSPLAGGHFTHVYQLSRNEEELVLRVTPPNDEIDVPAMQAILEWMDFLSTHGASVPRPIRSRNDALIELVEEDGQRYVVVVFEKARGVLGEELPPDHWNEALFRQVGRAAGRMHALAKHYPPGDGPRRPDWDEGGNLFNPTLYLDALPAAIGARLAPTLRHIQALPRDEDCYGLAHLDLHFANLFIDVETDTVTIFDFDDCAYGWYVMDVAVMLFDILVLYPGSDREAFAARFLENYLRGYLLENHVSSFWIGQLPHFLKLLEIGVYAQLCPHYDPRDADAWVSKFMTERESRIENDVPYVEVDFEAILGKALETAADRISW